MGAALAIVGLVGSVVSAVGNYDQMKAQAADATYRAQVAANNAKIENQNAGMEYQAGAVKEANQGLKTRSTIGTTKAQQAASGVDVNTGSFTKAVAAESELGLMDALTIRSDAAKKAYAHEVAATSDTAEQGLLTAEASQANAIAPVSALGTFLGGASSVGSSYLRYASGAPGGGGASPLLGG